MNIDKYIDIKKDTMVYRDLVDCYLGKPMEGTEQELAVPMKLSKRQKGENMKLSYSVVADNVLQLKTPLQSLAIQLAKRLSKHASTVTLEASNGWIIKQWSKS